MKNITKKAAMGLAITMISFSSAASLASEKEGIMPIAGEANEITQPYAFYNSFTGTVKSITDNAVSVEDNSGGQANFILSENTYFVENAKIAVGAEITGFYEAGKPMIMIYPPQYSIDIIAPVTEGKTIKADKFDDNLLSADKSLKLNIGEETEVIWENGTVINWFVKPTPSDLAAVLTNRKLIVSYDFTTKSIPPQTTPKKIIVLSQQESQPITTDVSAYEMMVNSEKINVPSVYQNNDGILMVPLRAIAEKLGFEVSWNDKEQSVLIGEDILLTIGNDNYVISDTAAISLGAAPILKDATTFVPLSFFKDVAKMKNTYVSEGQIIINNIASVKD